MKTNPDEIGKMIGGMMEDTAGTLVVAPKGEMMVSGNLVAVPVRFTGNKGDKQMDMNRIDLFEVANGKITHVSLFSENQQSEDEFWGK